MDLLNKLCAQDGAAMRIYHNEALGSDWAWFCPVCMVITPGYQLDLAIQLDGLLERPKKSA